MPQTGRIISIMTDRAVCRIIDANFNRAREASRVIEEFCRFALNSGLLYERAKKLRHELSSAISQLDMGSLIAGRDTPGDVGVGKIVEKQMVRGNLKDCFIAGCKRLTEALRVLTEVIQAHNPSVAQTMENLRYAAYTLEKDIVLFSDAVEKYKHVKLYIVISSNMPVEIISLSHKCIAGGADCIQMRAKSVDDDRLFATAVEFARICKDGGVLGIINDRADIAIAACADGVHLGQNDLPVEQVRRFQSAPLIIGKSTHTLEQMRTACNEYPTYVGLGPVYKTPTKPDVRSVGLEYVRQATDILKDTGISHAAIGGVNIDNVEDVLNAGARVIAVCSAVTQSSDPESACSRLKQRIESFLAG